MARSAPRNKIPPFSVTAEKAMLGYALREPAWIATARTIVPGGADFFRPEHARLYDLLLGLPADPPPPTMDALIAALRDAGWTAPPSEEEALRELADAAPDEAGAEREARVVREKACLRRLIETATDIIHDAYFSEEPFDTVLGEARRRLNELGEQ